MAIQNDNTLKGIAFAFSVTFVGSSAAAASKWISAEVSVPVIVLVQYIICMAVTLPWIMRRGHPRVTLRALKTQQKFNHLIRGLFGFVGFYTYYAALQSTPLVDTTLLRNSAPLFVPLVAWLWMRVQVPAQRWLPIMLGFAGIALILRPESSGINEGHILGLSSGLALAGSMVGTRILSRTDNDKAILFYYFLISLICSIPLGIAHWQPVPLWTWPYLIYIGLSIFIAMWLYTKAFTYAKASVVAPITYFAVVISGFLGWFIWDHVPTNTAFMGVTLVMLAGALTVYMSAREDSKTA